MRKIMPWLLLIALFGPAASGGDVEKIIYHLHNINQNSYLRTISNIENLEKGMPGQKFEIKILLQGKSLQLLDANLHSAALNERFKKLLETGSDIETSRENYQHYAQKTMLIKKPKLVSNIFDRIIQLQQQGYQYITP